MILLYLLIIMNKSSLLSIEELIFNLDSLNKNSIPKWGKMNSSQMLGIVATKENKGEIKLQLERSDNLFVKLFLFYFSKKYKKTPRNLKTLNSIKIREDIKKVSKKKDFNRKTSRFI